MAGIPDIVLPPEEDQEWCEDDVSLLAYRFCNISITSYRGVAGLLRCCKNEMLQSFGVIWDSQSDIMRHLTHRTLEYMHEHDM